jgi:hypothetical protein
LADGFMKQGREDAGRGGTYDWSTSGRGNVARPRRLRHV